MNTNNEQGSVDLSGLTDDRIEALAEVAAYDVRVGDGGRHYQFQTSHLGKLARAIEREVLATREARVAELEATLAQRTAEYEEAHADRLRYAEKIATRAPADLSGLARYTGKSIASIFVFETEEFCLLGDVQALLATKAAQPVAGQDESPMEAAKQMVKRWPDAQAFIKAHPESYFESNEPVPRMHLAYAVDLLTNALQQGELGRVDEYTRKLAMHLWRTHYLKDSPQFELLDDTYGVLSQIDNMLSGLVRSAPAAGQVPEGWRWVPVEPTQEMLEAAYIPRTLNWDSRTIYRHMLDAAPVPPLPAAEQPSQSVRNLVDAIMANLGDRKGVLEDIDDGVMQEICDEMASTITSHLARRAKAGAVVLDWHDGAPPHPWDKEWFIAETTYGDRVVLIALPEEFTYDFKTADQTYIMRDKIVRWMQFPDSGYVAAPTLGSAPQAAPVAQEGEQHVPSEAEQQAVESKLYLDLTQDAMKLGYDGIPAALEALRKLAPSSTDASAQKPLAWMKNHGSLPPSFTADPVAAETWAMLGKPLIALYAAPASAQAAQADVREGHVVSITPGMGIVGIKVGRLPEWLDLGCEVTVTTSTRTPADDSQPAVGGA